MSSVAENKWKSHMEGFDMYKTRQFEEVTTIRLQNDENCVYDNRETKFKQGELANCWLIAAIESLRQKNNQEAWEKVVRVDGDNLEFRFWENGEHKKTVKLATSEVPSRGEVPIFTYSVEGNETWGILLEKAYAKWVGSYEGLEGGFWADAIQSFTGGVVERIRIKEKNAVTDNLFDIMRTSLENHSSLCGIIKKEDDDKETYHACCITAVHDEDGNRSVHVFDPSNQESECVLAFDDFKEKYHRLDLCHTNWNNLSLCQVKKITPAEWKSELFHLEMKNGRGKINITLTGTDVDQKGCILAIELIQDIKSDKGENPRHVKPWEDVACLQVDINDLYCTLRQKQDHQFTIEVPQETLCFIMEPGTCTCSVKVSTDKNHRKIYVRLLSKSSFTFDQNQEE